MLAFVLALLAAAEPKSSEAQTTTITLVGTSDVHGRLESLPILGGFLAPLRAQNEVVLLDAGDMFQGTLESDLNEGAALVDGYKALGYNAVAIGNHEFDYGPVGPVYASEDQTVDARGALKARLAQARGWFPFLAANLRESGSVPQWPNLRQRHLFTLSSGVRIGVIGAATEETLQSTLPVNTRQLDVLKITENVVEQAKALRNAGANLVFITAHAGGECKKTDDHDDVSSCDAEAEIFQVARALPPGLVTGIVAGHTHKAVSQKVAGIPIIQSNAFGKSFGRIDFTVDTRSKKVVSTQMFEPQALTLNVAYEGTTVVADASVTAAIAPALARAKNKRDELIGIEVVKALPRSRNNESVLAGFVADELHAVQPQAHFAFMNGGGIRADLPAGPLHYGDLYKVLPFDNHPATFKMRGADLRAAIVRNITSGEALLAMSGGKAIGSCSEAGLTVEMFAGDSKTAVGDDEIVSVVTNDFLAMGGDGIFDPKTLHELHIATSGRTLRDSLSQGLAARGIALDPGATQQKRFEFPHERPFQCPATTALVR